MNKLEQRYSETLEGERMGGTIDWWAFESIKLKLADKTYYSPDFLVMRKDGWLECHEVKGFWEDDARVKIKCAAAKFPFKFVAIQFKKNQGWVYEDI